ncbi:hydrolase [Arthrobacter sp. JZ12]|uniref:endonuclease/exonuclease/phosphatase family protein n=1 Tax=Arthrobacter sp. JZ12 TaxID=2654190 RepID=UPI002B493535|nr:endonuclease/exonuclease/phosphatase family protein [Arthrobacter sp. JZ12]WRH25733.1 hydrolase [Arthrobacter sp. JZ12]
MSERTLADKPLIGRVEAPELHVMTYNIRRRVAHVNPWSHDYWGRREPLIRRLLAAEQPTILGVQEALPDQMPAILEGLGERYRSIGRGRNADGQGEQCPLIYDADRLELLEWDQDALSSTPNTPGSSGWGNLIPRILVIGRFRDRDTGKQITAVNTHLDHMSRKSRQRSAVAIRSLAARTKGAVVVLGDFNTGAASMPYEELTKGEVLADAWDEAGERLTELWGTFPHYRAPKQGRKRIDWVMVNSDVTVVEIGINTTRYNGAWPSDHTPVQAIIRVD